MEFKELEELEGIDGIHYFQKLPIFSLLTFDETTRLARIAIREQVAQDTVIIERGEIGQALFIICDGELLVTRGGAGGNANEELGRLAAGELCGEMSLVDDLLTSARVTTMTDCMLLKIPATQFQDLLASDDRLALKVYRSFCRALSERLRHANDLLASAEAFSVGVH